MTRRGDEAAIEDVGPGGHEFRETRSRLGKPCPVIDAVVARP